MAKDPDLREYEQMTEVVEGPGGPLDRQLRSTREGRNLRRGYFGNTEYSGNWNRVQAAQDSISRIAEDAGVLSEDDARYLLKNSGIKLIRPQGEGAMIGDAAMAIHPVTGRRVPAVALASEIDSLVGIFEHRYSGNYDIEFKEAAEALRTGKLPGGAEWAAMIKSSGEMPAEPWARSTMQDALNQARGDAADTHLKRNLRNFKQRQRVAADIADPSVMEGMRKGIDRADKSAARRLAATALRGTRGLAGGALGLLGSMPADIALRAMDRPDDMTVAEDYLQDEALVADALNLPRRDEMPVFGISPERRAAAMMAIRSGRTGLRPPPVDGVIQDAITDEEIQFALRDMADPGNPTVSRPRYEAPKAASRTTELK
jgi:hypothetical protein